MTARRAAWLAAAVAASVAGTMFVRQGAGAPAADSSARAGPAREFWSTYREATDRRNSGDCAGAVALYERAVALRPDHEDALYYLGNCRLDLRAYDAAIDAYRRLVAVNPIGSSRAYIQWALVHASLAPDAPRDLDRARRLFQQALDLDPDSGALLGLAEVTLLLGDTGGAELLLARVDAGDSMSVAAPYLLGYLGWRRGTRDAAWRAFRLAVERGVPKTPPVAWSEEGNVKADPALRWRALARQSVLGAYWIRLRAYIGGPGPDRSDMEREYRLLDAGLSASRRVGSAGPGSADGRKNPRSTAKSSAQARTRPAD
jgi:tetratricopeptide (TPR) repeat protein